MATEEDKATEAQRPLLQGGPGLDLLGLDLEDDAEWNVDPENLKKLEEKYKDDEFPLFMESIPSNIEGNSHLEALQHILFKEQTAEERALSFKDQGNEHFQDSLNSACAKERLEAAAQCYSEGIKQECSDSGLNSLLYSNRGHIRLLQGDYPACIDDCRSAVRENAHNVKAYFRAAKASYYLRLFSQCIMFCTEGLQRDPGNTLLQGLLEQAKGRHQELERKKEERERTSVAHSKKTAAKLQDAFQQRGLTVSQECEYDLSLVHGTPVSVDAEGKLHWSCIVLYPEYSVSEAIMDFHEDACLLDHLEVMFPGGDSFAPWDTEHRYVYDRLSVYYEPGFSDGSLSQVPVTVSLRSLLSAVGHVSKVPIFHIMVHESETERDFKDNTILRPFPAVSAEGITASSLAASSINSQNC